MRMTPLVASLALLATILAGCASSDSDDPGAGMAEGYPRYESANDLYHYEFDVQGETFHFDFAPGAVGKAWNKGDNPLTIELPPMFLLISGDNGTSGSFSLAPAQFELAAGAKQFFLASPAAQWVQLKVDGEPFTLESTGIDRYQKSETQVISGENWYALSEHQEATFPHRTPGMPNYELSIDYFSRFFADLGYEVEVDPYDLRGATDATACLPEPPSQLRGICPESFANVVAMKPGTVEPEKVIFVAGGHFDMVPGTTHAAFDNTAGTVATLELARVLAPFDFRYTIAFGLWGGEEDGILGSQFWVQSHPEMRARILSYWNLDVIGMSWPAPLLADPDPHVIAAGPDAPAVDPTCSPRPCVGPEGATVDPVSADLLAWAQTLQQDWFGFPDEAVNETSGNRTQLFHYEGVAAGQAGGYNAVNAQSDHTPFMAAGIPSYFIFNGDALRQGTVDIHNERDTLANMTKYALYGPELVDYDAGFLTLADQEAGKRALVQSIETVLLFPLYHSILTDLGVYTPPAVAAEGPANVRPAS